MWYSIIIYLIMYRLVGTVLLSLFYRVCIGSIFWAKCQSFLVRHLPLAECPPLSLVDICWYRGGHYHVPTDIEKYGYFFFGDDKNFCASSSHVYLDHGILSKYQIACEPPYKVLSMAVTSRWCQNYHNPSTDYWSNIQTLAFWGLRSNMKH